MRSNIARYSFSFMLIHCVLALSILLLLGLGWYIEYMPPAPPARAFLLDLHVSLGLTSAILLVIQIFLQVAFKPAALHDEIPRWRKVLVYIIYLLLYILLILMLVSGYLEAVFSARPVGFWGVPLPVWGALDVTLANFFGAAHGIAAFVLVGLIFVHVGMVALNMFKRPGIATQMRPPDEPESRELALAETKSLVASKMAQSLAKTLRFLGWIELWVQFVLALIAGLLLAFATSGRAFSPGKAGFTDAIYWGNYGFLLLCLAVLLDFYYTRAARKVVLKPESYLHHENRAAFWFLKVGLLIGLVGVFISFTGVALSISLLIVKTISQPPGIAITNPSNMIRALDVFVLIVNFILLIAHFVGAGATLWLGLATSKARLDYIAISKQQD